MHSMIGRWAMSSSWGEPPDGKGFVIKIGPLIESMRSVKRVVVEIPMRDVCVKKGIRNVERLRRADINYPCIVLKDAENPARRKYRMIDGKHRVHKLVARNVRKVRCYVLEPKDVSPYVTAVSLLRFPRDAGTAGNSGEKGGILEWLKSHPTFLQAARIDEKY